MFSARKNQDFENLKLALQWNRVDIAKSDIFTGEEDFRAHQLESLMEMALLQNKPKFVELLLENGLNVKSFLSVKRLLFLYNSQKVAHHSLIDSYIRIEIVFLCSMLRYGNIRKNPLFSNYSAKSIFLRNTATSSPETA